MSVRGVTNSPSGKGQPAKGQAGVTITAGTAVPQFDLSALFSRPDLTVSLSGGQALPGAARVPITGSRADTIDLTDGTRIIFANVPVLV
jgi:hypothetical protein